MDDPLDIIQHTTAYVLMAVLQVNLGYGLFSIRFFLHVFWRRTSGKSSTGFLWVGGSSCHPTNSIKALKETQSTDTNQWPDLIL